LEGTTKMEVKCIFHWTSGTSMKQGLNMRNVTVGDFLKKCCISWKMEISKDFF